MTEAEEQIADGLIEQDFLEAASAMKRLALRIARRLDDQGRSVTRSRKLAGEVLELRELYGVDLVRRKFQGR